MKEPLDSGIADLPMDDAVQRKTQGASAERSPARSHAVAEAVPALRSSALEPDPVIEVYKRSVDRRVLRLNLERSVEGRLRNLMELQRFAEEVRRAALAVRPPP
jgi:hypothetical protein